MRVAARRLSGELRDPDPAARRAQVEAFVEALWQAKDAQLSEAMATRGASQ